MEKCNKDCLNCTLETCKEDRQISLDLGAKPNDRSEYYRKYYQEHKIAKKDYYTSKSYYLVKSQVTSTIKKLQKQIGRVNAEIILDELNQLETFYKVADKK